MTMSKDPPSQSYGVADSRFWRNVTLIALAHVALLLGLIRWSVEARNSSNAQSIVWISGTEDLAAGEQESSASPQSAMTPISSSESEPEKDEAAEEPPPVTAAKSEIELPSPTPEPTSTPRPTATPTPKPKTTPRPTPKPTLKKTLVAKASPKPSPKAKSTPTKSDEKIKNAKSEKKDKIALVKKDSASQSGSRHRGSTDKGSASGLPAGASAKAGGSSPSEFGWYSNMLHDRFYSAWIQPTTSIASGAKISTLVKVRIEKDGRVSGFEIINPSENVVVNESVAAIAKRVTQVDPPPAGLGNGDHYDVKINFELNTAQETPK